MSKVELGEIVKINPKLVWPHEERDFTPWVAENIHKVSEVIGIPIAVLNTEQKVFNCELDIYGTVEGKDSVVIIENQFNATDHSHLGQLITYAGALDASIVIWIASVVKDEHRSAIEWLNKIAGDKVSFFLLRTEVIQIDDSKPAIRFQLEIGPSYFDIKVREMMEEADAPRHTFRLKFWEDLFEYLANNGHKWAKNRRTTKDSWITSGIGKNGVNVNVAMASLSRLKVEINFPNDEDKMMFDKLYEHKVAIESRLSGERINWYNPENTKSSCMAIYRDYDKTLCAEDSSERNEAFKWISDMTLVLRDIAEKVFVKNEDI